MSAEELFAQLRDIHVPTAPGWWPLAPGWWLLVAVVLMMALSIWYYVRHRRAMQPIRRAKAELVRIQASYCQSGNTNELAQQLSGWLKRVVLYAFPQESAAGLAGQSWLEFLDRTAGTTMFTEGDGKVFARTVYEPNPKIDADAVCMLCTKWLDIIKPQILSQGRDHA